MSALIFDRTQADTDRAAYLIGKIQRGETLTEAEQAEYFAGLRGCYNITDLNRVEAKVRELAETLRSYGYSVDYTVPMKGTAILPNGYQQIEYIQSSGTQYIDTGYVITSENMRVVIKFAYTAAHSDATLFGSETTGITGSGEYSICPYGNPQFFVGGSKSLKSAYEPSLNEVCTLDIAANNGTLTDIWNGTRQNSQSYTQSLNRTYSVAVFGNNISGAVTQKVSMKLYSFQIYDGNVLVRDYIPCKNPVGTVGLYDFVGGEFYTTLTAAEAVALPEGYTQVEYLQSSGTQCINTGFKPNQNTRLVMDATLLSTTSAYLYGCRGGSGENYNNRFGVLYNGSYMRSDFGTGNGVTFSAAITANERYVFDQNKNVCKIGAETVTNSEKVFTSLYPILMFGVNEGGVNSYLCSMRLYSCRIYDNGTLIRNFVPARNASGTLGLYDTVNGAFYTNAGSGTFTAGADIVGFTAGAEISALEDRESDVLLYLANIAALRDVIQLPPDVPPIPTIDRWIDWMAANDIERIVYELDRMIYGIVPLFRRCGTFRAGKNAQHLLLAKGVN